MSNNNDSKDNSFPFLAGLAIGSIAGLAFGAMMIDKDKAREKAQEAKDKFKEGFDAGKEKMKEKYQKDIIPKAQKAKDEAESAVQNQAEKID